MAGDWWCSCTYELHHDCCMLYIALDLRQPLEHALDFQVKQGDADMGEVIVEGIGHRLECPEGIRLSWTLLKPSGHGEEL